MPQTTCGFPDPLLKSTVKPGVNKSNIDVSRIGRLVTQVDHARPWPREGHQGPLGGGPSSSSSPKRLRSRPERQKLDRVFAARRNEQRWPFSFRISINFSNHSPRGCPSGVMTHPARLWQGRARTCGLFRRGRPDHRHRSPAFRGRVQEAVQQIKNDRGYRQSHHGYVRRDGSKCGSAQVWYGV